MPTAARAEWAETPDELSRRALLARTADRYLDPERTKYLHLLDGGISDNLALRGVVNGWQVSTIVTLQSGTPFNITRGSDVNLDGNNTDRVNVVGNYYLDPHR